MGELLVIVSEKNDIVYQRAFAKESDEEYCRLIILLYGSIDVLTWEMASTNSVYFDCLEAHDGMTISASVMPSGYKSLFAHSRRDTRPFLDRVHRAFAAALVSSPLDGNLIGTHVLDEEVDKAYKTHL